MLKKRTFNWDMSNLSDSKLGKTIQKSTVSFSIYIQLDWEYLTTQLDPRWTMKLQHLQTIQTSHCQRMSKTWHHDMLQHSAEPTTHQALAPSAPIWLLYKSMFATEAFIFSASAKAWRQGQIKVGILFVVSTVKTWSLKSHEQFTFNWEISNLSDSKLGKTIQKSTVSFSISIQLDWEYLTTQLDPRWTMKLQHLQTIQTSHCQRISKTLTSWHAAAFSDSAEPIPHTRPWPPRRQSGCPTTRCSWRNRLSSVPRPRPGGSDRLRLASRSWFLPSKPDHWNPTNNSHSAERYRISLIQNLEKQSRNPRFHSASPYSWIGSIWQLNSIRDERWNYSTYKPSKLLTVKGCRKHDIMTCRSIQRFCGAHHTPGLGALVTNLVVPQNDVRDGLVDFKSLGQGLEAATGQGWRLDFKGSTDKTWFLKCSEKKDIQLRHV